MIQCNPHKNPVNIPIWSELIIVLFKILFNFFINVKSKIHFTIFDGVKVNKFEGSFYIIDKELTYINNNKILLEFSLENIDRVNNIWFKDFEKN